MVPSSPVRVGSSQEFQFLSGKNLLRLMVLLGLASASINVLYYSRQLQRSEVPTNVDDGVGNFENERQPEIVDKSANLDLKDDKLHSAETKKADKANKQHFRGGDFVGGQIVKRDRQGRIVVNAITALSGKELGVADEESDANGSVTLEEASKGREPILQILREAGIQKFDAATVSRLPTWDKVEKLYGKGPVVYGLDTCETFRKTIPAEEASLASAGIFNSGTNTLAMYLNANCIMPENKKEKYGGMRWQPPWGKHMVANRKWTNTVKNDKKVNKTTVMPVAVIRDPYSWFQSMCKHPYVMNIKRNSKATKWHHSAKHCPNLVPNQDDLELFPYLEDTVPVQIKYPEKAEHWDSLAHLWSDWYGQYFHADYPRLIVRFEDMLFNAKEMVNTVCECAGGVPREPGKFAYVVDSGKFGAGHASTEPKTNMISAMVKYGTDKNRYNGMTTDDLAFAHDNLDAELMSIFQYEIPPPPA